MRIINRHREGEIKDAIATAHNKMACAAEAFVGATHSDTREDPENRTAFLDRTFGYLSQSIQEGEKALAWIKELQAKGRESQAAETLAKGAAFLSAVGGDGSVAAMVAQIKKNCNVTSRDKAGNRVYKVAVGGATIASQLQAAFVIAQEGYCDVIVHFANGEKVRLSADKPPVSIPTMQYGITPDKVTDVFGRPKSTDSQGNPATSVYANGKPMPGSEPRQVETNAEKVQDNGIYYALTIYTADDGVIIRKALKAADKHGDDDIVVYLREGKHLMAVSAAREVVARLERIGMLPPDTSEGGGE